MSKDNNQLPFIIRKLEHMFRGDVDLLPAHVQTRFEIICVTAGTGTHIVNDEKYEIKSGVIYAALPGQKHKLIAGPAIKGYALCFRPDHIHTISDTYKISDEAILYHFFSRHCQLDVREKQMERIVQIMASLENEISDHPHLTEIINSYLQILLLYIRREVEHTVQSGEKMTGNLLLKKFLFLLENNYKTKKSVADYARELFITPNHLNRVIKKTSGHAPGYHIRQRVMQEARRRLKYSGGSLKEIAYHLGFDNTAHFSKLFKNTLGKNFTEFKREIFDRAVV